MSLENLLRLLLRIRNLQDPCGICQSSGLHAMLEFGQGVLLVLEKSGESSFIDPIFEEQESPSS